VDVESVDLSSLDLSRPQRIHVVGVGGAGMSAIASVLNGMGHDVSGSDMKPLQILDRLAVEGIEVRVGHDPASLSSDLDVLTRSTAVPDTNPEVVQARALGVPVASRADVLAAVTRVRSTIAIAGTHGKTTTASLLAVALLEAGLDPSFIIGGEVNEIGSGARWAEDDGWFVVEADESDGTFLTLERPAGIVTSVELDHLNHYGSDDALLAAFDEFAAGVNETLICCADDPGAAALARRYGGRTYGTADGADLRIVDVELARASSRFRLIDGGTDLGVFDLSTPGLHNVTNAAGAVAMALRLGADPDALRVALRRFTGVARRYQFRGAARGVSFVDDYAHLPTEVEAALSAAVAGGWDRVVCVFQPHRYSRTNALWPTFGTCFGAADVLVVTDVYPSGEAPLPGVTGRLIVDIVERDGTNERVHYVAHRDDLVAYLLQELRPGDLCLTLGAGDLTTLPDELLGALEEG
jgi:UDP-N-acetylmuramate--alanine ligase